jgi:TFIIF-interacting CTD phosphatase-like protein
MKKTKKINVILDLDNTLIYSIPFEKFPKKTTTHLHKLKYHNMDNDYYVFERPGLQDFLDWLYENFNIMVWSAASPDYVEFIVKNIVEKNGRQVDYVLNSDNCEESQEKFGDKHIKNLKMLWDVYDIKGYGPYNTLIIDDLKMVCKIQPNNSIQIKSFNTHNKNSLKDSELKNIKSKLNRVSKNFNKNINKKGEFKLVNF